MKQTQYLVVLSDGQWMISLNQQHYGPYDNQSAAIKAAVDAAHTYGQEGHEAQVLIHCQDNRVTAEWTYGHDPYPLTGQA